LPSPSFDSPLYVVKYGTGGSEINNFLSGGTDYLEFWNNYVVPAINDLIGQGKTPLVYFGFWQGEADSNTQPLTDAYSGKFDTFVSLWQTNLGATLPFNIFEIYELDARDTTINGVFATKSGTESFLNVIETGDLSSADNLHFDYTPLKTAANRLITSMLTQSPVAITTAL